MSRRTALSWNTSRRLTPANLPTTLESGSTPGQSEVPAVRFSANGLTTLRWDLLQDVGGCHDLGISSIGLWRPKVLEFGEERAIELLNDAALDVSSLSWIGGFTGTNGHGFRDSIWDAREAIRFAGKVGADTVVVLSGSRGSHTLNHARRLLLEALRELADDAEAAGVALALPPMHPIFASDWTFLKSLDEAVDILAMTGHHRVKLAFDTYHLWREPDLLSRLPELVPLLGIVQVSDWREPTRSRQDRLVPGDGVIPLAEIFESLIRGGYQGHFDLQVWSDDTWGEDYLELLRRARDQFESLLPHLPTAAD